MLLTLTVEQRVLLHLWDTPLGDNPWEGRPELTQAGVSEAVGIARKHLPHYAQKLGEKAHILEETRHVAGAKQRCRVYGLSNEGRRAASELVEDLHMRKVKFEGEEVEVKSLHNHTTALLDLLRNIDSSGTYQLQVQSSQIKPHQSMVGICLLNIAWPFTKALSEPRGRMESLPRMSRPF